ncbi:unnamed protein product [Cylicocyclus nassatus]|uniref:Uncharacterized protein n=1 Tax=Cylicocyclus nassatus TaxID=53992 RepID=A0AA36GW03_CYLNA|nr:unnamed protein product [Cylicocyclus nassatus]
MVVSKMLLIFVAYLFSVAYGASSWDMVEVLLVSEHYGHNSQHSALDDFNDLFDEFAESQGIHFNKRNFRELQTNTNGLFLAKYGLRGIDCEGFRKFLSGIKAQKYHLHYASVKCGPATFSLCMAFSCEPYEVSRIATTTSGNY